MMRERRTSFDESDFVFIPTPEHILRPVQFRVFEPWRIIAWFLRRVDYVHFPSSSSFFPSCSCSAASYSFTPRTGSSVLFAYDPRLIPYGIPKQIHMLHTPLIEVCVGLERR